MNVADKRVLPNKDTTRSSNFDAANDGVKLQAGGDSGVRVSPEPAVADGIGDGATSSRSGIEEDMRPVNDHVQIETIRGHESDPSKLLGSGENEDQGAVKGWISSKLLGVGQTKEHQHESKSFGDKHDPSGAAKVEEDGVDAYTDGSENSSEPTTDSGAAVRSFSDKHTPSFTVSSLDKDPTTESQELQGL